MSKSVKRRSLERFELLNHLVDVVLPKLPSATHGAVLLVCYRHARQGGLFRVSSSRIAKAVSVSDRHVRRVLDDLERLGAIQLKEEHQGPIPRKYRILPPAVSGESDNRPPESATLKLMVTPKSVNGDTEVTIKANPPPKLMVTPMSANGDIYVR